MEMSLLCIIEGNEAMEDMMRKGISSIFSGSRKISMAEVVLRMASARSRNFREARGKKNLYFPASNETQIVNWTHQRLQ